MMISLAPMQGYTDLAYRTALSLIGGVDVFYAPYIRVENGLIKSKCLVDIDSKFNVGLNVVPQVMANTSADFMSVAVAVLNLGYNELNWNLGCSFPMVANHQLGAGLLPYPDIIDKVLTDVEPKIKLRISVKLRLGWQSVDEIWPVLDVLNHHDIKEIIVHPRIGKQMYKGDVYSSLIPQIIANSKHQIAYNGDLRTSGQVHAVMTDNPQITHLMIGRGLLYNPFLANEVKGVKYDEQKKRQKLLELIAQVGEYQLGRLQGAAHFLLKMQTYWDYWSYMFEDQHKVCKMMKKCRSVEEYADKVQDIVLGWIMA